MREIKFRCWFPAQDGIPAQMRSHNDLCLDALTKNGGVGQGETLMQFTCLKDKNGVEIYEGDILETEDGSKRSVIEYDAPHFILNHIDVEEIRGSDFPSKVNYFTIIGNIYQHPNLLENK